MLNLVEWLLWEIVRRQTDCSFGAYRQRNAVSLRVNLESPHQTHLIWPTINKSHENPQTIVMHSLLVPCFDGDFHINFNRCFFFDVNKEVNPIVGHSKLIIESFKLIDLFVSFCFCCSISRLCRHNTAGIGVVRLGPTHDCGADLWFCAVWTA